MTDCRVGSPRRAYRCRWPVAGDDSLPGSGATAGNGHIEHGGESARLSWGVRSDPGDVREHNEDYASLYLPDGPEPTWERSPLFAVADGLGGHAAGEVASRIAVETVISSWAAGSPSTGPTNVRAAIRDANLAVVREAMAPGRRGMGTTLTALCFSGHEATIAHVGDSRAYLVHGQSCVQLTSDHSRVGDMLRMRLITPEQAANHPARSQLTRSLGADPLVQVDVVRHRGERGDSFVLCSDGLWDVVPRTDIAEVVGDGGDAQRMAAELVDLAIKRGTADNVTAVVGVVASHPPIAPEARRSFLRRRS